MVNKSVVAKSNEDIYPESLEAMTDKSVGPWAVVVYPYSAAPQREVSTNSTWDWGCYYYNTLI